MKSFASPKSRHSAPRRRGDDRSRQTAETSTILPHNMRASGRLALIPLQQQRGPENIKPGMPANKTGAVPQQSPGRPMCKTLSTRITTRKAGNAPRAWYGAKFVHKFYPLSKGCSLKGMEVSEVVSVSRDDFQTGTGNVKLGVNNWRLTATHELNQPDQIYSQAGPRGLGVNRLLNWPAVMAQDQLWYYRQSAKAPWQLGPGNTIKVTLSGNKQNPQSLKITTTDNRVSRVEPYRGPNIP